MTRRMKLAMLSLVFGVLAAPLAAQSPQQVADGAQVWARNCSRCHKARSTLERTDRAWRTIMSHMRARANLRKSQAEAVAAYLVATNLPEQVASFPRVGPAVGSTGEDDSEKKEEEKKEEGGESSGAGSSGEPQSPGG